MLKYFNVGKIVNTHGIKGEVRVLSRTDFPEERFAPGSRLYLFMDEKADPIPLEVASWRKHKEFELLSFRGYDSIDKVEPFKGGMLKVAAEDRDPLPEGEYYFHEIIGCVVQTTDGEEIGTITSILQPGANDVWVVLDRIGKEYYIPYIDEVVKKVDVDEKRVLIEVMEGLLD